MSIQKRISSGDGTVVTILSKVVMRLMGEKSIEIAKNHFFQLATLAKRLYHAESEKIEVAPLLR